MILVVTAERITGLQYHRQIVPFRNLESVFDIEYSTSELALDDNYLKRFSVISFLRECNNIERYKKLGLKVHFDIDDYWVLPSHHQLCKYYKETKYAEKVISNLKAADFITTTTPYLAERIKPYNKNVYVLANAIDPKEDQWKPKPTESIYNRLRFGYIAGAHHVKDVEMIHPELVKVYKDQSIKNKWQLLTAGFNWNKDQNGKITANPYYRHVEHCFTGAHYKGKKNTAYNLLSKEYAYMLSSDEPLVYKDMNEPYQRLNGRNLNDYGNLYDEIDVALIPLCSNEFNRNKSQLKIIEAGFKKKACIVSNVIPYTYDIAEWNALLTEDNEWHRNIKFLINNPERVGYLAEAMYKHVNEKYHIDVVNVERKQIFQQWLK